MNSPLLYMMVDIMQRLKFVNQTSPAMLTIPTLPGAATIVTGFTSNTTGLTSKETTVGITTAVASTTTGVDVITVGGVMNGANTNGTKITTVIGTTTTVGTEAGTRTERTGTK
ncbi:hypothetical protein GCM10011511_35370 [Puia dinghuensis]|uniref:Uncharacterized protein n=1 Tax=Puia dinghuensis TaxID=1792502 RepID=A0A8J2UF08_9BACT|nr:hypothetical protein GCM10011511_35370 [Puia dinghuensis]